MINLSPLVCDTYHLFNSCCCKCYLHILYWFSGIVILVSHLIYSLTLYIVYGCSLKVELDYFWWSLSAKTHLKSVSFLLFNKTQRSGLKLIHSMQQCSTITIVPLVTAFSQIWNTSTIVCYHTQHTMSKLIVSMISNVITMAIENTVWKSGKLMVVVTHHRNWRTWPPEGMAIIIKWSHHASWASYKLTPLNSLRFTQSTSFIMWINFVIW